MAKTYITDLVPDHLNDDPQYPPEGNEDDMFEDGEDGATEAPRHREHDPRTQLIKHQFGAEGGEKREVQESEGEQEKPSREYN
ncbi:MAG: hypothetical protein COV10_02400 [Candidatus Vogelbacteria bacterium CG10_big_fil_rev_8_21_14_0_10_51_16]|uniref:Uncharacterized protein n=1 Tax=Candidatus Vogelbacteria bacterium CG10_big_fil_rev_8_21_14_0_10_51_16 TaxID=1975045 RepID=A0A2H0REI1_9BACT|nr:MAG: hypothetical protein COV10_02400 [Candidatus Vogelbacteria bacterium CG10_big_fil_rev_8_21_14_0_10_51_16]